MAGGAFAGFEQRVDRTVLERFLKGFMTPQAFRAPCAGLKLDFMQRISRRGKKKRSPDAK